jgi:hypothetical protein
MGFPEMGGCRDQFGVDARLVLIREGIGDLHDHHAIEQRLVLAFLEKPMKFRQIGMSEDGFIQIDQGKARDLDILFLGKRQKQVQEFPFNLEDLNHL